MLIENHLPFAVVVCTYDVGDFLFWIPWQVHNLEPGMTRSIAAHDHGRCRLKIEIVDGPRLWVLKAPADVVYTDREVVEIGARLAIGPAFDEAAWTHRDPDRARAEFLRRHQALVVLADEWIPSARRSGSHPVVRGVLGDEA
ncbi:MAG: hypothetical protein ABIY55_27590 [Kofleriaceae bacterium]